MSMTTTLLHGTQTITHGGKPAVTRDQELIEQYTELIQQPKLGWTEHLRLRRLLGKGGQGVVYLSERRGAIISRCRSRSSSSRPSGSPTSGATARRWSGWPRSARASP